MEQPNSVEKPDKAYTTGKWRKRLINILGYPLSDNALVCGKANTRPVLLTSHVFTLLGANNPSKNLYPRIRRYLAYHFINMMDWNWRVLKQKQRNQRRKKKGEESCSKSRSHKSLREFYFYTEDKGEVNQYTCYGTIVILTARN